MEKAISVEKELKILRKQTAKSKAGPVKDNVRSPPSSSGKKFKSTARSHFDPQRSGKQLVSASDSDKESVATNSTRSSRKRFIAPWTRVGVLYQDEHPKEQIWEWMAMICHESYTDAGPSAKRKIREDDLGPFEMKRVGHVTLAHSESGEERLHSSAPAYPSWDSDSGLWASRTAPP
jgi:hypothetical protein